MRIIGGKDYYDGAAAVWHDDAMWVRDGKYGEAAPSLLDTIKFSKRFTISKQGETNRGWRFISGETRFIEVPNVNPISGTLYISYPIVYFCGKLHYGVRLSSYPKNIYFWNEASFDEWLESKGYTKQLIRANAAWQDENINPFDTVEASKEFVNSLIEQKVVIAFKNNKNDDWSINEPVIDLDFAKKLNPHDASQEIIMYVTSRMVEPDPAKIIISDEVRLAKHGMDHTSFRKPPSKKNR